MNTTLDTYSQQFLRPTVNYVRSIMDKISSQGLSELLGVENIPSRNTISIGHSYGGALASHVNADPLIDDIRYKQLHWTSSTTSIIGCLEMFTLIENR